MSDIIITLVGIGNRMVGDDGIALSLLEALAEQLPGDIEMRLWENTDALSLAAELMEIHTPLVIVDCAEMGLQGGEFRWLKESECQLAQRTDSFSTHALGVADALALAQTLGFMQTVFIFAIQPAQLNVSDQISISLQTRKRSMENSLLQHLQQLRDQLLSGG